MLMKRLFLIVMVALTAASCGNEKRQPELLDPAAFADTLEGKPVALYTLKNGGLTLQVTNFGARVASIWAPDRKGNYDNIVVGRARLEDYVHPAGERFLGACVGPVANRLADAKFPTFDPEEVTKAFSALGGKLRAVIMFLRAPGGGSLTCERRLLTCG